RARDPAIYYSDTWEWDGRGWLQVSVGSGPSARSGHAMAYDAARRKVVLLGGAARSTGDPAIWEWDGARWRRIAAVSPGPAGIVGHQLAYDARRDRVVFFGSSTSSESETWEWDGGQRTWAKIAPTGAAPPPRGFAGMTYDPVRGKVVLYGGTGASQPLGDLWEWDGAARTWSAVEPANTPPAPGQVEAMFYDLAQKKIVVVSSVSEIWTWDGGARSWSRSTVVAPLPEPRTRFAMAYVPPGRAAVLFGGMALTDTWLWSGTAWTEARSAFPVPSANGALVYDPTQARVLAVKYGATIETWEWKDQVWTQLVSTGATPATLVPRNVAFDPRRQRLFGFRGSPTEAWEWNGSQWAMVATPPVFASPYSSVVYDPTDRRIQVFVGNATIDQAKWNGTQWQLGALLGARRLGAALAVDPARNRTVLFSGFDGSLTREETWELSGTSWSRRNPGQSPRPTDSAMMTYHPGRRRSILVADSRTWEWDGDDWSDITPVTPGPSFVSNLAYDASQQSVVADSSGGKVWSLRYESAQTPDENCHAGVDVDRDGLIGCADPDCWAYCSPFCPPGQPCDAAD
ncbi:MAG TPA: kelch repeat-containing protein, partial [Kofleriaceae bacterium]|nr:kelch repeat-containing protein [Kofleriaceae bacterium]